MVKWSVFLSLTGDFLLLFQIFFFVPFYDNKYNKMRLERIRSHMKLNIELIKDVP